MALSTTEVKRPNGVEFESLQAQTEHLDSVVYVDFANRSKASAVELGERQQVEENADRVCRFTDLDRLRLLTEVSHLQKARIGVNTFDPIVSNEVEGNHYTQSQELMPHAVTTTHHKVETVSNGEKIKRISYFLGKTALGTAESGREFHGKIAQDRVDVEVAEAIASEDMQPGEVHVLISPKMTRAEATYEQARQEHLADDDAIRISYLDETGQARVMKSMLVRDIPLQAWVDMLADPDNIFGKSVVVENTEKSLSVMRVFNQLTVPVGQISSPLEITQCAATYIKDDMLRKKVEKELEKYRDQEVMDRDARQYGSEWLQHSQELAESLETGEPTSYVKAYVYGKNQHVWCKEDLKVIDESHDSKGNLIMTRALAAVIENLQRKLMEMRIASLHAPEFMLRQVGAENLQKIQEFERVSLHPAMFDQRRLIDMQTQATFLSSLDFESANRGCSGGAKSAVATDVLQSLGLKSSSELETSNPETSNSEKITFDKRGVCRVQSCRTRPGETNVGPCSVCKICQDKFDAGEDPTKEPAYVPEEKSESPRSGFLFITYETKVAA